MEDVRDAPLFCHGNWTGKGRGEIQRMGRQLAVLGEVVIQQGRKVRKQVCADLEVVLHDADVGVTVVGNEDGRESLNEEHMIDPSCWPCLALALLC